MPGIAIEAGKGHQYREAGNTQRDADTVGNRVP